MALYYKDYLEINQDYVPVFSDEIDKLEPKRWKYFVPHQSLKEVLTALIKATEGANAADRKPIWLTGSYGTGKTFGAFVIKHMLEDDIDSVKEYFDQYPLTKPLFERLHAIRNKGNILVVYRSGSASITSSDRLLLEIQQSVQRALDEGGYNYAGGKTAFQSILSKLTDPETTFNFEKAFRKYRLEFGEYSDPQQVIDALHSLDNGDLGELVERVARVMEKEGFAYLQNVEHLKAWIDDVIKENNLRAIWFVWDEFTDYFRQNREVTTLQEMAHASAKMPFYLFLITHRNIDQFAMDEDARRVLRDRFTNIRFEMSDVTSYQLMANVIKVKEEKRQEWETKLITLWGEVERCVRKLSRFVDSTDVVNEHDLKKLVPIHPLSAYLLSVISRRLSSNQRTMFQFLEESPSAEGDSTKYNFGWFIQTHSLEGWHWLTADMLWDYFFKDVAQGNPDYPEEIHQVINYYSANYDKIDKIPDDREDELRVFKGAMLLVALSRVLGSVTLLKPIESNLELMFEGTHLRGRLADILVSLHERKLINFNLVSGGEREVVIPLMFFDEKRLSTLKENLRVSTSFEKSAEKDGILSAALLNAIALDGPLATRFVLMTTSARNLKRNLDNLDLKLEPYEIGLLFVIPSSDDDAVRIERIIQQDFSRSSRIVIAVVGQSFTDTDLDNWLTAKAHAYYCRELGDEANRKYYDEEANGYVERWMSKAKISSLITYFMGEKTKVDRLDELDKYLEKISLKVYPYGPENLVKLPHLYKTSRFGKTTALAGMGQGSLRSPYGNIRDALAKSGFWDSGDMFEKKPDHAISKMKKRVDEIMESDTSVYLADVWEELMNPPFGLAPSGVACFLFGFLMKDYVNAGYYKDDGINPIPLSAEGMADAIISVMKPSTNTAVQIAISKMTPEHKRFCEVMSSTFRIKGDMPRNIKQNLRYHLNEIEYPLWTLKYYVLYSGKYDTDERLKTTLENLVDKLCQFISADDNDGTLPLVDEIVNVLDSDPAAIIRLDELGDPYAFKEGMRLYLENDQVNIMELANKVNLSTVGLINRIKGIMVYDANWLWDEEKLNNEVKRLENEFKLISALNRFTGNLRSNLDELTADIRSWLDGFRLPREVIAKCLDDAAAEAFGLLISFASYSNEYSPADMAELACLVEKYGPHIKERLSDPYNIFRDYVVNQKTGIDLTEEGIREIYSQLPPESYLSEEAFRRKVNDMIYELETARLMRELKDLWRSISGCTSPRQWSQETNIPILCLPGMEELALVNAFEIVNESNEYSKHAIEEAIGALERNRNVLSILADQSAADIEFILAIAGDYSYLVFCGVGIDSIKGALEEQLGNDVYSWGKRKSEAKEIVLKYLTEYYKQQICQKVLRRIDAMSPESVKDYLKELIENEPLVGIRILTSGNEG